MFAVNTMDSSDWGLHCAVDSDDLRELIKREPSLVSPGSAVQPMGQGWLLSEWFYTFLIVGASKSNILQHIKINHLKMKFCVT